jgi:hypothetical protein
MEAWLIFDFPSVLATETIERGIVFAGSGFRATYGLSRRTSAAPHGCGGVAKTPPRRE